MSSVVPLSTLSLPVGALAAGGIAAVSYLGGVLISKGFDNPTAKKIIPIATMILGVFACKYLLATFAAIVIPASAAVIGILGTITLVFLVHIAGSSNNLPCPTDENSVRLLHSGLERRNGKYLYFWSLLSRKEKNNYKRLFNQFHLSSLNDGQLRFEYINIENQTEFWTAYHNELQQRRYLTIQAWNGSVDSVRRFLHAIFTALKLPPLPYQSDRLLIEFTEKEKQALTAYHHSLAHPSDPNHTEAAQQWNGLSDNDKAGYNLIFRFELNLTTEIPDHIDIV